jgi:hypothetical protein
MAESDDGSGWCIGFDFVALMDSSCGPPGKQIFLLLFYSPGSYFSPWKYFIGSTGFDYSRSTSSLEKIALGEAHVRPSDPWCWR